MNIKLVKEKNEILLFFKKEEDNNSTEKMKMEKIINLINISRNIINFTKKYGKSSIIKWENNIKNMKNEDLIIFNQFKEIDKLKRSINIIKNIVIHFLNILIYFLKN